MRGRFSKRTTIEPTMVPSHISHFIEIGQAVSPRGKVEDFADKDT